MAENNKTAASMRVQYNDDGTVDEIACTAERFHIEMLSDMEAFIAVQRGHAPELRLTLVARRVKGKVVLQVLEDPHA